MASSNIVGLPSGDGIAASFAAWVLPLGFARWSGLPFFRVFGFTGTAGFFAAGFRPAGDLGIFFFAGFGVCASSFAMVSSIKALTDAQIVSLKAGDRSMCGLAVY